MKITCEKCSATYMIPLDKIGEKGRSVKCAKCAHTWRVMPTEEEIKSAANAATEDAPTSKPTASSVPAVADKGAPSWMKLLPVTMVILIFAVSGVFYKNAMSSIPGFGALYRVFGVFDTEGVTLHGVKIKKVKKGGRANMVVKAVIINHAEADRQMPHLRAAISSKRGDQIFSYTIKSDGKMLKPKQKFPISFTLRKVHKKAESIELDIGNNLELFIR